MSTSRPFAYNIGDPIDGTEQVGSLVIGTDLTQPYASNYGGVQWWAGPDEELGYVICKPIIDGDQPNPLDIPCYIGFERSESLTDQSFIDLANTVFPGNNFSTASGAKIWMNANGYWTSYAGATGATGGAGWLFYSDEGNINADPPIADGNSIFLINGSPKVETYNPNKTNGVNEIYFNLSDSGGTDYTTQFTNLQDNGGTLTITQGANTVTYTSTIPGTFFVEAGGGFFIMVTGPATQTVTSASSFIYGDPISLTFS